MSDYRFQLVRRYESHTGNEIDCLHVMIDSNSLEEIAHTYIPLDDILESAVASGMMTHPKRRAAVSEQELIELLADKEHESWSRWMKYLFSKCTPESNGACIPIELVARWNGQSHTPYADLSEQEKQSDRAEVAHILPIIKAYYPLEAIRDIVFDAVDKALNPPEQSTEQEESPFLGGES